MIIGYIRVSTVTQDLENQRNAILRFAHEKKMLVDRFIEVEMSSRKSSNDRKLDEIESLGEEDTLIITELSRLGRSVSEVVGIVNDIIEKRVHLLMVKESIDLKDNHSLQSKVMITMFSLFAELERDLISQRTKEALATKKAKGVRLGRPKGPGKSKLDPKKDEIQKLLDVEPSKLSIAKIMGVRYATLWNFVKKHKMTKNGEIRRNK